MSKMEKVSDNLYRGPRPKSYADLKPLDFSTVVSLEKGYYDFLHDDDLEKESPASFGLSPYKIKCSDIFPPNFIQVTKFLAITKFCRLTYVHCLHGVDRTGFMVAAYRMSVENWTYKEAVKEMFSKGFHKWPYIWWVPFLLLYRGKHECVL